MADAITCQLAAFSVHIDIAAKLRHDIGTDTAHGLIHCAHALDGCIVAGGFVHCVAVIHIAACLPRLGNKEQVTRLVQLLHKRLIQVPVKCAVSECRDVYSCRELAHPGNALVNLGTAQKSQYGTKSTDAALGGVALVLVKCRSGSAARLTDYHADTALADTCRLLRYLLHVRHFRGVKD